MTILIALAKEIVGMFLADGRLPVWLVLWIAMCAILAYAGLGDFWRGVLLLGGAIVVLAVNVLGAAYASVASRRQQR
ncbi:MAG: hypothetical protein ACHQAY_02850 [Hyphomicrobiales bacterium]